jgi:hypothetical protein
MIYLIHVTFVNVTVYPHPAHQQKKKKEKECYKNRKKKQKPKSSCLEGLVPSAATFRGKGFER